MLAAILHDLGLGPEPTITTPPQQKPLVRVRSGRLAPRRSVAVRPFGLLGPDRRVRATVEVAGAAASGVRARLELRCDGTLISTRTLARGMKVVSIDRPNLGPAENCAVTLTNTSGAVRDLRPLAPTLGRALAQRLPRSACSRSIDSKRALKLPSPNVVAPWRSITSKKSVGRSCAVFVKICSR